MKNLPKPLDVYFTAANNRDQDAFIKCFAENAIVKDEGEGHKGHAEIEAWNNRAIKKYNCSYEVLKCEPTLRGAEVTAVVSGTFPGSPIELTYSFTLENGLIKELGIK